MLQVEWVKQGVTSTGVADGFENIVLGAAPAGYIRFQDTPRIKPGAQVLYTLQEGDNKERGLAYFRFDDANSTYYLERIRTFAVLTGTTYSELGGSIAFGTTSTVSCESVAINGLKSFGYAAPLIWSPEINSVISSVVGIAQPTIQGTITARPLSVGGDSLESIRRLGYVSAATAGSFASWRTQQRTPRDWERVFNIGISDAANVATARSFIGLRTVTTAPTNVSPATLTNVIGIGHESGGAPWQVYVSGSTAQAAIPTGIPQIIGMAMRVVIKGTTITIYPNMNNSEQVTINAPDLNNGIAAPDSTALMGEIAWRTNNTTALAVGLDMGVFTNSMDTGWQ
jgi:hypothetical protein